MIRRKLGFTLIELLVVVAIIALLLGILLPALGRAREIANQRVSGTNLKGLGTAFFTYGNSYRDAFPKWSKDSADDLSGKGFQPNRSKGTYTSGTSNPTAALWLMVRDGSVSPAQYINPSTDDVEDPQTEDTDDPDSAGVQRDRTWDFFQRRHLSYSTISMYHDQIGRQWTLNAEPAWILMGDANNGLDPENETDGQEEQRNSQNHTGDGQNFLFGDTHVDWFNDTFEGPGDDNVYTYDTTPDATVATTGIDLNGYANDTAVETKSDIYLLRIDQLPAP